MCIFGSLVASTFYVVQDKKKSAVKPTDCERKKKMETISPGQPFIVLSTHSINEIDLDVYANTYINLAAKREQLIIHMSANRYQAAVPSINGMQPM